MNAPWYKFSPSDWLSRARFLSPEQAGYLIRLECESWNLEPRCSLPADPDKLWQLAGAPSKKRFEKESVPVLAHFELREGRYYSPMLVALDQARQAIALERQAAGKRGAQGRWPRANANEVGGQQDGNGQANAIAVSEQKMADKEEIRVEEKRVEKETSLGASPQSGAAQEKTAIGLPLNDGSEFYVTKSDFAEYVLLYPAADVEQELRSMRGWLISNPTRRKTRKGIMSWVGNWICKAQDRGHSVCATASREA